MNRDWTKIVLWIIYVALLMVLLPHTAWAFSQFEPDDWGWLGWVAALSFEGAIAAFTWRLKQAIENTPAYKNRFKRFRHRYVNVYLGGLVVAIVVSSLANWAHSVEYGQAFAVFAQYGVPPLAYAVAFGGILPLCSLLFARILADAQDIEEEVKTEITTLHKQLREQSRVIAERERQLDQAQHVAMLVMQIYADDKARRILAARELFGHASQSVLAAITQTSPSYVSQIVNNSGEDIE